MSNSPLATRCLISPHRTSPRNHVIDTITIHCYVGQVTAQQGLDGFHKPSKGASCNYVIGRDGEIGLCVEEKDRSWCTGGKDEDGNPIYVNGISGAINDHRAITIEVASDNYHPYAVTDAAYDSLIRLLTDICKRNNIKQLLWRGDKSLVGNVNLQNLTVHRWFARKACVPTNTEVLTRSGWVPLGSIQIGDEIACADLDNLRISFEQVYDMVEPYYHDTYTSNGFTATKDHRVVHFMQHDKHLYKIASYNDCLNYGGNLYLPMAGYSDFGGLPIEDDMLRFLIAVQADGHYMYDTRRDGSKSYFGVEFHLKKHRKIARITNVLQWLDMPYKRTDQSNGSVKIRIYNYDGINIVNDICEKWLHEKCFTWEWIQLSPDQAKLFLAEIMEWDGCAQVRLYCSKQRINLDAISAVAVLNGVGSNINGENIALRENPYITLGEPKRNSQQKRRPETLVSCVSVKTGIFLCRQNGKTFVTGNCPGDYLYNKHGEIAAEVNRRLGLSKPAAPAKDEIYRIRTSWADGGSQIGAYRNLDSAKAVADQNPGYAVYNSAGEAVYCTTAAGVEYRVQVVVSDLNIRTGPGTTYDKAGFTGQGIFTIVDTQSGPGSAAGWGKLKSGAGWISLDYATRL